MWDVAGDWSTKEDLDSCEDWDRDEGEKEGVEYGLERISRDSCHIEEIGNYKALRTCCVNRLFRSTVLSFLHSL